MFYETAADLLGGGRLRRCCLPDRELPTDCRVPPGLPIDFFLIKYTP